MIIVTSKPYERLTTAERATIVALSQELRSMRRLCRTLGVTLHTLEAAMACRRSVRATTIRRLRASLARYFGSNVHVHGTVQ